MTASRILPIAAGLAVALFVGMWVGGHPNLLPEPLRSAFVDERIDTVARAQELIEDNYFEEVDAEKLRDRSISSMVDYISRRHEDRFSHYFDPETYERFQRANHGRYSGVGLTVSEVDQGLRVAGVFEDSPAEEAGVREQDLIVQVDGRSIAGVSSRVSTAEIKGRPGTSVRLTVVRPRTRRRHEIDVERREIEVPVVSGDVARIDGRPVAAVSLASFTRGAHGILRREIEELDGRGAEALVLDLRGNGGGLLQEAVLVASIFVDEGTIVSTEGRTRPERTFEAVGDALPRRPMAVLVNPDSASAAEIVTAALAEHGTATVVGECPLADERCATLGKGSFQEVIALPNGGALDLTVGEYLTAEGTSIEGRGVRPEVRIPADPRADEDVALQRAMRLVASELDGR